MNTRALVCMISIVVEANTTNKEFEPVDITAR